MNKIKITIIVETEDELIEKSESYSFESAEESLGKMARHWENNEGNLEMEAMRNYRDTEIEAMKKKTNECNV